MGFMNFLKGWNLSTYCRIKVFSDFAVKFIDFGSFEPMFRCNTARIETRYPGRSPVSEFLSSPCHKKACRSGVERDSYSENRNGDFD
jgi:hypothetical protein